MQLLSSPPATLTPRAQTALKPGHAAGPTSTNGSAAPLILRGGRCSRVVRTGGNALQDRSYDATPHPTESTVCDRAHASVLRDGQRLYLRSFR